MLGCLWLLSKIIYSSTTVSTMVIQILKIESLIWLATSEPAIFPMTAGMESFMPLRMSSMRLRRNVIDEVRFCNTTAIRFVPFDTLIGRPITVKSVIEMNAPPPASVLITPTTMPESTSMAIIIVSLIALKGLFSQFVKVQKKRETTKIF